MIIAKGMYKVENGEVVVDPNANTTFATISSTVQLPDGSGSANSGSSGSAPAGGSGSPAGSGSQAPSDGGSETGGSDSESGESSEGNGD